MNAALNGTAQETQTAVGETVVDGQVQCCIPGQDLACFHRRITLA